MAETETTAGAGAATENNGGAQSGEGGAQTQPAAQTTKDNNRQYGVFTELVIDLTASAGDIAAQVKEAAGNDPQGNALKEATVLMRVGRAIQSAPKAALEAVGDARDLNGDYEVIADSSRSKFPKVTSSIRRVVSIG